MVLLKCIIESGKIHSYVLDVDLWLVIWTIAKRQVCYIITKVFWWPVKTIALFTKINVIIWQNTVMSRRLLWYLHMSLLIIEPWIKFKKTEVKVTTLIFTWSLYSVTGKTFQLFITHLTFHCMYSYRMIVTYVISNCGMMFKYCNVFVVANNISLYYIFTVVYIIQVLLFT